MVRAEDSRPRGRGFESRHILDGCKRFVSYYIKEKLKIKVCKWDTPKKKYLLRIFWFAAKHCWLFKTANIARFS